MIENVKQFMLAGGNTVNILNVRQAGLYIGFVLEEVSEMMSRVGLPGISDSIQAIGDSFKQGHYDERIGKAIVERNLAGLLDDCMDIAWVSYGVGFSLGTDVHGASVELSQSNMSKVDETTGKILKDENGKILKGANYKPANFQKFVRLTD